MTNGVEGGGGLGGSAPKRLGAARPPGGDEADDGQGNQGHQRELPRVIEHVADDDDELEDLHQNQSQLILLLLQGLLSFL